MSIFNKHNFKKTFSTKKRIIISLDSKQNNCKINKNKYQSENDGF